MVGKPDRKLVNQPIKKIADKFFRKTYPLDLNFRESGAVGSLFNYLTGVFGVGVTLGICKPAKIGKL